MRSEGGDRVAYGMRREDTTMARRELIVCFAMSGVAATAIAQTTPAPENWTPINRAARTITGRVSVWRSDKTGKEVDPALSHLSPGKSSHSAHRMTVGQYVYDAGAR